MKHYINGILKILNGRNTISMKKPSISEQILLLKEQVRTLKLENKKLQEEKKAQLNITEDSQKIRIVTLEKKQAMIGQQYAPTITAKV